MKILDDRIQYGDESTDKNVDEDMDTETRNTFKKLAIKSELITLNTGSVSEFLSSRSESLTVEDLEPLCITQSDFLQALKKVQPSSKREGFATVPGVTWQDIGALHHVREELRMSVIEPVKHPLFFQRVGISSPVGVLLYGPPGLISTDNSFIRPSILYIYIIQTYMTPMHDEYRHFNLKQ